MLLLDINLGRSRLVQSYLLMEDIVGLLMAIPDNNYERLEPLEKCVAINQYLMKWIKSHY